jgi:hypothetical protein
MLSLSSPRWSELRHAYGAAHDVPAWLLQLETVPTSAGDAEPWFSLWSALAHQGDVYSASFAAVPHVVAALASAPSKADTSYFQFPAWVEICRSKNQVAIPSDLSAAYVGALARLPALVAEASKEPCSPAQLACMLAAVAVANGQPAMAEAALELTPEVAEEFLAWQGEQ